MDILNIIHFGSLQVAGSYRLQVIFQLWMVSILSFTFHPVPAMWDAVDGFTSILLNQTNNLVNVGACCLPVKGIFPS